MPGHLVRNYPHMAPTNALSSIKAERFDQFRYSLLAVIINGNHPESVVGRHKAHVSHSYTVIIADFTSVQLLFPCQFELCKVRKM